MPFQTLKDIVGNRLPDNPRQTLGKSSKKSLSNGNRYESWQNNHIKNILTFIPCGNCSTANCPSNMWSENTTSSNGCKWQCPTGTGVYIYCNGTPPPYAVQKF